MTSNLTIIQEEHLSAEYQAWLNVQGFPQTCAEETLEREDLTIYHNKWLFDFCNRWEFAMSGHYWINGTHILSDFPEHAQWLASAEYAAYHADWGNPFIPEGFNAHHDDTNLKPGFTVTKR